MAHRSGPDSDALAQQIAAYINRAKGIGTAALGCTDVESHHSDLHAISRCRRAGADLTLTVRAFAGDPPTAVVTLYTSDGESRVAHMLNPRAVRAPKQVPAKTSAIKTFTDSNNADEGISVKHFQDDADTSNEEDRQEANRATESRLRGSRVNIIRLMVRMPMRAFLSRVFLSA